MKIVLNSHCDDAGAQVCIWHLHQRLCASGIEATLNDWGNYDRYDVAVFMAYDHEMDRARLQNANIRVILADPKQSSLEALDAARAADGLLVSSVEQRDVFLRHNRNILVYYMFPNIAKRDKKHESKDVVIIGYHGNRVHLECMYHRCQSAINELARKRKVEFWAMYNINHLGKATVGIPDSRLMEVRHIQWSPENYHAELANIDIGIVPNEIPIKKKLNLLKYSAYPSNELMYEPFDHMIRFKASCNPGRLYPYACLGIPVISDFTPSAGQFIHDGESGFIVSSPHGWFEALETLADSPQLRQTMANSLRTKLEREYNNQLEKFMIFCRTPQKGQPIAINGETRIEQELSSYRTCYRPYDNTPLRRFARKVCGSVGIDLEKIKQMLTK